MAKLLQKCVDTLPKCSACLFRFAMDKGKPAMVKFANYVRVEMRPPRVAELTPALAEAQGVVNYIKSGSIFQRKVKDLSLDAVVAIEVLMWFFVGEIIGRRSLLGYKHVKGAYIVAH